MTDEAKSQEPSQTIERSTGQEACDAYEGTHVIEGDGGAEQQEPEAEKPVAADPFPGDAVDQITEIIEEALTMGSGKTVFLARHLGDLFEDSFAIFLWAKSLLTGPDTPILAQGDSYPNVNTHYLRLCEVKARWDDTPPAPTASPMSPVLWLKLALWLLELAIQAKGIDPSSL